MTATKQPTWGGKRPGAGPKANKVARLRQGDTMTIETSGELEVEAEYSAQVLEINNDRVVLELADGSLIIINL